MNYATPIGCRHPPVDWHNPPGPSTLPTIPLNVPIVSTNSFQYRARYIPPISKLFHSAPLIFPSSRRTLHLRDTLFDELLRIILLNIYTNFVRVHYRVRIKGLTLLRFFETDPLWNGTLAYVRTRVRVPAVVFTANNKSLSKAHAASPFSVFFPRLHTTNVVITR